MTMMKSLKELESGARVTGPVWTRSAVEARFIHWVEVLRKLPDREIGWLYGSQTYWPKISRGPSEISADAVEHKGKYEQPAPVRRPASCNDIALYEETSNWFGLLPRPSDRRLVTAVATLKIYRSRIDWEIVKRNTELRGYHYTTLKRRYEAALDLVAGKLNLQLLNPD
jgi:hypothetical protein